MKKSSLSIWGLILGLLLTSSTLSGQFGKPLDISGVWQARVVDPFGNLPDYTMTMVWTPTGEEPLYEFNYVELYYDVRMEVESFTSVRNEDGSYSYPPASAKMFMLEDISAARARTTFLADGRTTTSYIAGGLVWDGVPLDEAYRIIASRSSLTGQTHDPFTDGHLVFRFDHNQIPNRFIWSPSDSEGRPIQWSTRWGTFQFDRIAGGNGPLGAKGKISGEISTSAVTLTERDNAVHRAQISLYL